VLAETPVWVAPQLYCPDYLQMDFMKWISSLDEILYEVMSWLLFFPLTFWRSLLHPLTMMDYADDQLALPQEKQYSAVLSPPLFLALSLLLAHGFSIALGQPDTIITSKRGLADLVNDQTSELALRIVIFAAFSLFAAARLIQARGLRIDRESLQMPFYAQCYPTAVFALALGLATSLMLLSLPAARSGGGILACASMLYYLVVETRWFSRTLGIGCVRAFGNVLIVLIESIVFLVVVGFLFTR
jgi:hypothetical protein